MAVQTKKLYYSMREVTALSGVAAHILRYWENEFKLLNPRRSSAGVRQYQLRDLFVLREIVSLLYHKKYTIAGAKVALTERKAEIDKMVSIAAQSSDLVNPFDAQWDSIVVEPATVPVAVEPVVELANTPNKPEAKPAKTTKIVQESFFGEGEEDSEKDLLIEQLKADNERLRKLLNESSLMLKKLLPRL